jgi:hypothetical protein
MSPTGFFRAFRYFIQKVLIRRIDPFLQLGRSSGVSEE